MIYIRGREKGVENIGIVKLFLYLLKNSAPQRGDFGNCFYHNLYQGN